MLHYTGNTAGWPLPAECQVVLCYHYTWSWSCLGTGGVAQSELCQVDITGLSWIRASCIIHSFITYATLSEILKSFKITLQSLYIQHYFDIGVSIRSIIGQFLRHDRTWYIDCIISNRAVTSNTIIGRASSSIQSGKSRCKYQ